MNAPAPDPSSPLWLVVLAIVTAFVTFVDLALRLIAPRTKTTVDDQALSFVQRALAFLKKLNPLAVWVVISIGVTVALTLAACRPVKDTLGNAPTIDCTILDAPKLEVVGDAIEHVLAESPGDWKSAAQAAAGYGAALGGCALAELVQHALSMRGSTPEQWSAHKALEDFRSTVAGGATFRTADGDL